MSKRLTADFFRQDALCVAPLLLGKKLVRQIGNTTLEFRITDVEVYCGKEDQACHASKGRTPRTEIMYADGGRVYVYLIYGMYWLLNFVTGEADHPQAILIRGVEDIDGPGRVGKSLQLDKSFYGEDLIVSDRLWVEDAPSVTEFETVPRVGIDYAGEEWRLKKWRFILKK